MINQELLDYQIVKAKKRISGIVHKKDKDAIGGIMRLNKEICLVVAEFKCQKCGNENELQYHHLIMRKAKDFMDFWRYASQRYYWANGIILCRKCHCLYHEVMRIGDDDSGVLSQKFIDKQKIKYEKQIIW